MVAPPRGTVDRLRADLLEARRSCNGRRRNGSGRWGVRCTEQGAAWTRNQRPVSGRPEFRRPAARPSFWRGQRLSRHEPLVARSSPSTGPMGTGPLNEKSTVRGPACCRAPVSVSADVWRSSAEPPARLAERCFDRSRTPVTGILRRPPQATRPCGICEWGYQGCHLAATPCAKIDAYPAWRCSVTGAFASSCWAGAVRRRSP